MAEDHGLMLAPLAGALGPMGRSRLVVAAPAGPLVSDTFARADSTTSLGSADTGQAWSVYTGTWGITGGQAYLATASGGNDEAWVDAGTGNCTARAPVAFTSVATATPGGIMVRSTDASNYLVLVLFANTNALRLYKIVAGAVTQLASVAFTIAANTLYTLEIDAREDVIQCSVDGVSQITYTLTAAELTTFPTTAGRVGLFTNTTNFRADEFEVTA